jgi:hypothetical protein
VFAGGFTVWACSERLKKRPIRLTIAPHMQLVDVTHSPVAILAINRHWSEYDGATFARAAGTA